MIFHSSRHVESRVSNRINANFDMTLFNILYCVLYSLCHLESLHEYRQPTPAEGTNICTLLNRSESLPRVDNSHLVKLIDELVGLGNPVFIIGFQDFEFGDHFGQLADQLIVLGVVVAILNVVASQNSVFFG